MTRKRVHWGHTPFRVKSDPEFGQLSPDLANSGVRLTQLWVIFCVKLTDSRVTVVREWSLAHADPSVFRVYQGGGKWRLAGRDIAMGGGGGRCLSLRCTCPPQKKMYD